MRVLRAVAGREIPIWESSPQTSLPGSRTEGASDGEAGRRPGRPPCKDLRHQVTPRPQRWRGSHPARRAHTQKPAASPCSHRHQARLSPPVPLSPTSAALDPPPARPCKQLSLPGFVLVFYRISRTRSPLAAAFATVLLSPALATASHRSPGVRCPIRKGGHGMQTNDQLSLGSHVGRWEGEGCERQHQLSRSVSDATASRTRGQSRPRLPFSSTPQSGSRTVRPPSSSCHLRNASAARPGQREAHEGWRRCAWQWIAPIDPILAGVVVVG